MHKDAESVSGSRACTWLLIPLGAPFHLVPLIRYPLPVTRLPFTCQLQCCRLVAHMQMLQHVANSTHFELKRKREMAKPKMELGREGREVAAVAGQIATLDWLSQHIYFRLRCGCSHHSGASFQRLWPSLATESNSPVKVCSLNAKFSA